MLNTAKKYSHLSACNWFLDECISAMIVPKTFRISNQPHLKNDQFSARWTEASKIASIEWMKIALENDKKQAGAGVVPSSRLARS